MRANLDATGGQIMAEAVMIALGPKLGRLEAHHVVEEACRKASAEHRHLEEVLGEDARVTAHLTPDEIERLFDPLAYQGVAQAFIDRQIAASKTKID
jgi:3-carboxy-cis,cis-muconate cycloisomerase